MFFLQKHTTLLIITILLTAFKLPAMHISPAPIFIPIFIPWSYESAEDQEVARPKKCKCMYKSLPLTANYKPQTFTINEYNKAIRLFGTRKIEEVFEMAPKELKQDVLYLRHIIANPLRDETAQDDIPNRIFLKGDGWNGKTLLARAIPAILKCPYIYTPATGLCDSYDDSHKITIKALLAPFLKDKKQAVIILDALSTFTRLRKIEYHPDRPAVSYLLEKLEQARRINPNLIVIGVAMFGKNKLPLDYREHFNEYEIPFPSIERRKKMISNFLHETNPTTPPDESFINSLAKKSDQLSAGAIDQALTTSKVKAITRSVKNNVPVQVTQQDIADAFKSPINRYKKELWNQRKETIFSFLKTWMPTLLYSGMFASYIGFYYYCYVKPKKSNSAHSFS